MSCQDQLIISVSWRCDIKYLVCWFIYTVLSSPCVVLTVTCTTNKCIIVISWAVKAVTVGRAPPLSLQPTTQEWAVCLQWAILLKGWIWPIGGVPSERVCAKYLHWASNAMLDRPVACQMAKLEQVKAENRDNLTKKNFGGGLRCHFEQQLWTLYAISDDLTCFHVLPSVFSAGKPVKEGVILFDVNLLNFLPKKLMLVSVKIYKKKKKRYHC